MYIGQVEPSVSETWLVNSDQGIMEKRSIMTSPALAKVTKILLSFVISRIPHDFESPHCFRGFLQLFARIAAKAKIK